MLPPPVPAAPSANAWLPASTFGIAVPPSATSATASATASADLAAATPSTSTTGPGTLPGFLSYLQVNGGHLVAMRQRARVSHP